MPVARSACPCSIEIVRAPNRSAYLTTARPSDGNTLCRFEFEADDGLVVHQLDAVDAPYSHPGDLNIAAGDQAGGIDEDGRYCELDPETGLIRVLTTTTVARIDSAANTPNLIRDFFTLIRPPPSCREIPAPPRECPKLYRLG